MEQTQTQAEGLTHEHTASRSHGFAVSTLIGCVKLYQVTLGPIIGGQCRFTPSCSFYAIEALRVHGAWRGSWLTLRRLSRCHPFGGSGDDPVPHPPHESSS